MKILLADDHPIIRQGVIQILNNHFSNIETVEAANGHEVLSKVRADHFDLVILDISMPGRNGVDILKDLKYRFPKLPVLVLSMHSEEQYAIRSIKAGASGYLTKENAPDELISAIHKILRGKKYITGSLAEKLASKLGDDDVTSLHETLSDREYEIICMIASAKTTRQIADELSLSVKTVNTYRSRIKEKMGLKNQVELIRYAIIYQLGD